MSEQETKRDPVLQALRMLRRMEMRMAEIMTEAEAVLAGLRSEAAKAVEPSRLTPDLLMAIEHRTTELRALVWEGHRIHEKAHIQSQNARRRAIDEDPHPQA